MNACETAHAVRRGLSRGFIGKPCAGFHHRHAFLQETMMVTRTRTNLNRNKQDSQVETTVKRQRAIASKAQRANARSGKHKPQPAPVQAGARKQPVNPLPGQHLDKPGNESELVLPPRHDAPAYMGSGKLKGAWRSSPAGIPALAGLSPSSSLARAPMSLSSISTNTRMPRLRARRSRRRARVAC